MLAFRLGGWHLARNDGPLPRIDPGMGSPVGIPATPLYWTDHAVVACDRLRRLIAAVDAGAERRFAAMVVRAMVRLIVDGCAGADTFDDRALFPALSLRLHVSAGAIVVLDLRTGPPIA